MLNFILRNLPCM